jgi:hypothetical protein
MFRADGNRIDEPQIRVFESRVVKSRVKISDAQASHRSVRRYRSGGGTILGGPRKTALISSSRREEPYQYFTGGAWSATRRRRRRRRREKSSREASETMRDRGERSQMHLVASSWPC